MMKRKVWKIAAAAAVMAICILVPDIFCEKVLAESAADEYISGGFSDAEQAELSAEEKLLTGDIVDNPIVFEAEQYADETAPAEDPEDPRNSEEGSDAEQAPNGLTTYVSDTDTYKGSDAVFGERTLNIYTCGMKYVSDKPKDSDDGKVRFYTSDRDVAEVTKLGRVLALAPGECVMTAICDDGSVHTMKVVVSDKPETNRQIALTFDDGPCWLADELLDFLDEMNVKVTFFYEGVNIRDNVARAARAYNSGHEIGNHSWDHLELTRISAENIQKDIARCQEAIYNATGAYPTILRPPYGSYNTKVKENVGMPMVTWNVDPEDWKYLDADKATKDVINGAQDGNIILIHEIHSSTIQGVQPAIRQLIEDGVEFMTVTELLTRNGVELEPGSVYWKADRDPR